MATHLVQHVDYCIRLSTLLIMFILYEMDHESSQLPDWLAKYIIYTFNILMYF